MSGTMTDSALHLTLFVCALAATGCAKAQTAQGLAETQAAATPAAGAATRRRRRRSSARRW